jgi:hypothetical protein
MVQICQKDIEFYNIIQIITCCPTYSTRAALGIKELPRGAQVEMDGVLVKEADPE